MARNSEPDLISVSAVNEYRKIDTLTYLSLRYYLENAVASRSEWISSVASDIVLSTTQPAYHSANQFKELVDGRVMYRTISAPCANEALVESALLRRCAQAGRRTGWFDSVYSYELSEKATSAEIFKPYMEGLKRRHLFIKGCCETPVDKVVRYIDIKKFYPSIRTSLATEAWDRYVSAFSLEKRYWELGHRILSNHGKFCSSGEKGVLTGPIFSHHVGNLVLVDVDSLVAQLKGVSYCRYVDDIILVGRIEDVRRATSKIQDRLTSLGFEAHDEYAPKSITVSAEEWMEGASDYDGSGERDPWVGFVGDLKRFLLKEPDEVEKLQADLVQLGVRLPFRDYSAAVQEAPFLRRFQQLWEEGWFRKKFRALNSAELVARALRLRESYLEEFRHLAGLMPQLEGYQRKRLVPKLRYVTARLAYLASESDLPEIIEKSQAVPELPYHSEVLRAALTGNVDKILEMGPNVAQAVAQSLLASEKHATVTRRCDDTTIQESLAILYLNGVQVHLAPDIEVPPTELIRFARDRVDVALMTSANPFLREISCLHGVSTRPRHMAAMLTAFNRHEVLPMDVIEQLHQSE